MVYLAIPNHDDISIVIGRESSPCYVLLVVQNKKAVGS